MKGLCSTCEEVHPVQPDSANKVAVHAHETVFPERLRDDMISRLFSASGQGQYVMAEHTPNFGGGPCDGEGDAPQELVTEEENDTPHPNDEVLDDIVYEAWSGSD